MKRVQVFEEPPSLSHKRRNGFTVPCRGRKGRIAVHILQIARTAVREMCRHLSTESLKTFSCSTDDGGDVTSIPCVWSITAVPSLNYELTTITEKFKLPCTVPIVMVLSPFK